MLTIVVGERVRKDDVLASAKAWLRAREMTGVDTRRRPADFESHTPSDFYGGGLAMDPEGRLRAWGACGVDGLFCLAMAEVDEDSVRQGRNRSDWGGWNAKPVRTVKRKMSEDAVAWAMDAMRDKGCEAAAAVLGSRRNNWGSGLVRQFGAGRCTAFEMAPDGTSILCGYSDGNTLEISVETGQILYVYHGHRPLPKTDNSRTSHCFAAGSIVSSITFSPDSTKMLIAHRDGIAVLWDVMSRKMLWESTISYGQYVPIHNLENPEGSLFWFFPIIYHLYAWDLRHHLSDQLPICHCTNVYARFSKDGKDIKLYRRAYIWNRREITLCRCMDACNGDGKYMCGVITYDGEDVDIIPTAEIVSSLGIKWWQDVYSSGKIPLVIKNKGEEYIYGISGTEVFLWISPKDGDEKILAHIDGALKIIRTRLISSTQDRCRCGQLVMNGKILVVINTHTREVWDVPNEKMITSFSADEDYEQRVHICDERGVFLAPHFDGVELIDMQTMKVLVVFEKDSLVHFLRDGNSALEYNTETKLVSLWDIRPGHLGKIMTVDVEYGAIDVQPARHLSWPYKRGYETIDRMRKNLKPDFYRESLDSRTVYFQYSDGKQQFFELESENVIWEFQRTEFPPFFYHLFTQDYTYVLLCDDCYIYIYEVKSRTLTDKFYRCDCFSWDYTRIRYGALFQFSANGRTLLLTNLIFDASSEVDSMYSLIITDFPYGSRFILEEYNSAICSTAISPDGSRVVTGSIDREVKLWDATTGNLLATLLYGSPPFLHNNVAGVNNLYFLDNGSRVLAELDDETIYVWEVGAQENQFASYSVNNSLLVRILGRIDRYEGRQIEAMCTRGGRKKRTPLTERVHPEDITWTVCKKGDISFVLQIIRNIVGAIISQELVPGEQLPSIQKIADACCAKRRSVESALRSLATVGVLHHIYRRGMFVGLPITEEPHEKADLHHWPFSPMRRVPIRWDLDRQSDVPLYEQIMRAILRAASSGELQPGDMLPSCRDIARACGVNKDTVFRAFRYLVIYGVLYSRRGIGEFLASGWSREINWEICCPWRRKDT